ncbi:hypothetical protein SAMN05443245_0463 [Paraburkholderia fungorum]|uniref:Conjugal transfer protein TraK n=1 Tax=Paraburkholderia fungorum TaxID=134537 RepID=A0A1H0Z5D7_9BURK|nr:hypothetical protein SAMN05443245_0463 [Paraburkholderia fungorum]
MSERIAAKMLANSNSPRQHANRAHFLALRAQIRSALDDGWSMLAIYKTLHSDGAVQFSYQAFRRYVKELAREESVEVNADVSPRSPKDLSQRMR